MPKNEINTEKRAKKLKNARKIARLTAEDVASQVNVKFGTNYTRETIYKWEYRGMNHVDILKFLALIYKVEFDWLAFGEGPTNYELNLLELLPDEFKKILLKLGYMINK